VSVPQGKEPERSAVVSDARDEAAQHGLQTGGTRGSSNQGGPDRGGEREKDSATAVNSRRDRGSRSTQGDARDSADRDDEIDARADEPPRGPLPGGATREDYVGGREPHTSGADETSGASGKRNDLV
jgi:hypothetical protein